jgi:hypothetical protein
MLLGGGAEVVEDYSRLHAGDAALGIDLENIRHVLREIEDDGYVAALAGEGSSATAGEERSVMVAAEGDGREHVLFVAWNDYADRDLAVVGAVGRVEGAGAGVETDFSAEMAVEGGFEGGGVEVGGRGGGFGHRQYRALFGVMRISARRRMSSEVRSVVRRR